MMGLYIPGMKMPNGGYRTVEIAFDADGHPMAIADGGDVFDVIPVPPHGRLGDLDALWEQMRTYTDCEGVRDGFHDVDLIHRDSVTYAIERTPTIIPAEEGV